MPNCIFQFKQFAIWSHIGGFKVGTDAVLLGAWTKADKNSSVLEIGTGTGVISLMIAQRCRVLFTAVELDQKAAKQAEFNFQRSSFGNLSVEHQSIQGFTKTSDRKFDQIVCNPPYFQFSSKPDSETLQKAKHTDSLTPSELFESSARLVSDNGRMSIVIPFDNHFEWIEIAKSNGFYPTRKLLVRPVPEFEFKRLLLEFTRVEDVCVEEEMTLEEGIRHSRTYTDEFQKLMKDYFIRF